MRKAVMILLALAAIRLLPRAFRQQARAAELLALLFQVTLAAAANTSKAVSTENRTAALEVKTAATNTAVTAIQTQLTGNTGFASANGYGATSTGQPPGVPTGGPNGIQTGLQTSGQTGGAAAHTHTLPFYLPIATHTHDFQGHTHDFGGHNHPL